MASAADDPRRLRHLSCFLHSASTNLSSNLTPNTPQSSSKIHLPLLLPEFSLSPALPFESTESDSLSSTQSTIPQPNASSYSNKNMHSPESSSGFPFAVRMSTGKGRGPAFVGQVFGMCDLSSTGLMGVSTHFDVPFLPKRMPKWLKKMFAAVTKSERNRPVFRFFMDLEDAVSYVNRLNIPSGGVGACRLDIAYENFKEKPHLFEFIPNEKQVKEANKLLKTMLHGDGRKKVEGVPVFSSENLDIAIATEDSIKWYTPHFFDKNILDKILEESVDQHFHELIRRRDLQRRRDVLDDNLSAEAVEEMVESMSEPSEVHELMDEIGGDHPGIPLSVISKVAEIQLLYAVDRILLGNRWLRKAIGVQPRFPYVVDSFEKRSKASLLRANPSSKFVADSEFQDDVTLTLGSLKVKGKKNDFCDEQGRMLDFRFPFRDWSSHP